MEIISLRIDPKRLSGGELQEIRRIKGKIMNKIKLSAKEASFLSAMQQRSNNF